MEYSSIFVCLMGMGTVFFGLICLIALTYLMSAVVGRGKKAAPAPVPAAPQTAGEVTPELVAAVSAALARRHPCQNRIPGCSAVGSAPALGAGCREFESPHSDHTWTSAWRTSWRPPFFESAPVKSGVALFFAPVYPFAH